MSTTQELRLRGNEKINLSLLTVTSYFNHNSIIILNLIIYKKLTIDFVNKLIPTKRQTIVKVFLINSFPLILINELLNILQ